MLDVTAEHHRMLEDKEYYELLGFLFREKVVYRDLFNIADLLNHYAELANRQYQPLLVSPTTRLEPEHKELEATLRYLLGEWLTRDRFEVVEECTPEDHEAHNRFYRYHPPAGADEAAPPILCNLYGVTLHDSRPVRSNAFEGRILKIKDFTGSIDAHLSLLDFLGYPGRFDADYFISWTEEEADKLSPHATYDVIVQAMPLRYGVCLTPETSGRAVRLYDAKRSDDRDRKLKTTTPVLATTLR